MSHPMAWITGRQGMYIFVEKKNPQSVLETNACECTRVSMPLLKISLELKLFVNPALRLPMFFRKAYGLRWATPWPT